MLTVSKSKTYLCFCFTTLHKKDSMLQAVISVLVYAIYFCSVGTHTVAVHIFIFYNIPKCEHCLLFTVSVSLLCASSLCTS